MAKSLCRLLTQVNHALVANFFSAARISFNAIREKNLAKISGFTIAVNQHGKIVCTHVSVVSMCLEKTFIFSLDLKLISFNYTSIINNKLRH